METTIVYRASIGIMEKKMETTTAVIAAPVSSPESYRASHRSHLKVAQTD